VRFLKTVDNMNLTTISRLGKRLSTFVGGQSALQLLNAATGLALLRLLPKAEFAIYAVVLGIMGMIGILTDIGFGGAIQGLVGTRYQDKRILGSYIMAASLIRRILLQMVTVGAILLFVIFRKSNYGSIGRSELLFIAIAALVTLQFQAWASYYETPLLLNNRLVAFYAPQLSAAVLRMLGVFILYFTHSLSSTTVIIANTLSIIVMGVSYRIMARRWIEVPRVLPKEQAREMIRYLTPLIPMYVYTALQGQVSLFLITVFGHVSQIAEVAAAGRIGQLFLLLNSSNSVLVTPFFSKTPPAMFVRRLGYVISAAGAVGVLMIASVKIWPAPYLFLLGAKYSDLTAQVQTVVYTSAVAYFLNTLWAIAVARKWVFWWSGVLQVVVLTLVQLGCVVFLPLNSSEGVLKMNLYTTCGALGMQVVFLIYGLSLHAKMEAEQLAVS
jgi:O-antigen/teichoic acid export membrane protein